MNEFLSSWLSFIVLAAAGRAALAAMGILPTELRWRAEQGEDSVSPRADVYVLHALSNPDRVKR